MVLLRTFEAHSRSEAILAAVCEFRTIAALRMSYFLLLGLSPLRSVVQNRSNILLQKFKGYFLLGKIHCEQWSSSCT